MAPERLYLSLLILSGIALLVKQGFVIAQGLPDARRRLSRELSLLRGPRRFDIALPPPLLSWTSAGVPILVVDAAPVHAIISRKQLTSTQQFLCASVEVAFLANAPYCILQECSNLQVMRHPN
jgi:hypothetical protein